MAQAGSRRDLAQLGGYAGQQVAFGSQALRALTNVFSAQGLSSAILYVDLATAFHHLVRQLVTGIGAPADWEVVLMRLKAAKSPLAASQAGNQLIGVLGKLNIDPMLARLLRDIHESTWYSLSGTDLMHTFRGTRPGSPLADAVFHLLMTEVAEELREWLRNHSCIWEVFQRLELDPVFVIWSDDFAVPVASTTASALVEIVVDLTKKIQCLFTARGFTVNFEHGKTGAVLTFVGQGAPEMRREHLLGDRPGVAIEFSDGRTEWLHFGMKYKHLGTIFASSHSLEPELRQRIGTARATFQTVFRPVLGNKHFPLRLRLRFFQSLVCSKLFFGLGAWATPTLQQMGRLRRAYLAMLRKILGGRGDAFVSNSHLLYATQSLDARVRLASDRLLYAQKLFQVGPEFLQRLVHLEQQFCGDDSWMSGLHADLQWLKQVLPQSLHGEDVRDLTHLIDRWQQGAQSWKNTIRRAVRRHKLQEEIMHDAHAVHHDILAKLRSAGATFSPDVDQVGVVERGQQELHHCGCGRAFTSSQGLALHQRKRHGVHAPEHQYVTGATCPACLRFFWTSNRLAMHLAYVPRGGGVNQCFATLSKADFVGEFQSQTLPSTHANAVRLDSIQTEGPQPTWEDARHVRIAGLQRDIDALIMALTHYDQPADHVEAGLKLGDALTAFTTKWADSCRRLGSRDADVLADGWIRMLDVYGRDFDEWAAFVFQQWGEHMLPDVVAQLLDGELEYIDDQFAEIIDLFPRAERLRTLSRLRTCHAQLCQEVQQPDLPHRPVRRGTANERERNATRQRVPSSYHQQVHWQETLRAIQWEQMPSCDTLPTIPNPEIGDHRPCLLAVHLFSGRRREGDLHWHLQKLSVGLGVRFVVLSMDTAVSPWYGDLWHSSPSWRKLEQCYALGLVALTMVGSPCETYSEARFTPPPPEETVRWPRPVRSTEWFFGLPDLTNRELHQVHAGTNFFLQGLQALSSHIVGGGLFLSEHPGMPKDPDRPSTWRAPLTVLLRRHAAVCPSHINQWQWGADAVKPTGLLAHCLPRLHRSLYSCSLPDARRPVTAAIGKAHDGAFRTAHLKEYPAALSAAFATAFCDQVRDDLRAGRIAVAKQWSTLPNGQALCDWIQEAAQASAQIRLGATVLPDYQPR